MRAVAIVCAKDEGPRIGAVLDVLVPTISTLVVDDGSSDDTAAVAESMGAKVLRLKPNRGKGRAMLEGLRAIGEDVDVVFFCDADLEGLRREHVLRAVGGVLSGDFDMVVGLRDYGPDWNDFVARTPLISGERAVRVSYLRSMPESYWSGFGVEVAMNDHVASSGGRIGMTVFDGVSIHLKWNKDGGLGAARMVDMVAEVYRSCERVVGARVGQEIVEAPKPATLAARNASTEEVMGSLSRSIVDAASPKLLPPIWTFVCCCCYVVAGTPGLLASASVGALHIVGGATSGDRRQVIGARVSGR